jgi:hypothetical protein
MSDSIVSPKLAKPFFMNSKKWVLSLVLVMACFWAQAQEVRDPAIQMADGMRSNGKIYAVVAVLLTVLLGLLVYVIRLDRKISKLEKQTQ